MSWWPFNRAKTNEMTQLDIPSIVESPEEQTGEITLLEIEEAYKDDLPKSIQNNSIAMKRIKRSDKRAKRLYDGVDNYIESLRRIRGRIGELKTKKAPDSANP